jgi:hypothetical protein
VSIPQFASVPFSQFMISVVFRDIRRTVSIGSLTPNIVEMETHLDMAFACRVIDRSLKEYGCQRQETPLNGLNFWWLCVIVVYSEWVSHGLIIGNIAENLVLVTIDKIPDAWLKSEWSKSLHVYSVEFFGERPWPWIGRWVNCISSSGDKRSPSEYRVSNMNNLFADRQVENQFISSWYSSAIRSWGPNA